MIEEENKLEFVIQVNNSIIVSSNDIFSREKMVEIMFIG
jgi:hypothetical protein